MIQNDTTGLKFSLPISIETSHIFPGICACQSTRVGTGTQLVWALPVILMEATIRVANLQSLGDLGYDDLRGGGIVPPVRPMTTINRPSMRDILL